MLADLETESIRITKRFCEATLGAAGPFSLSGERSIPEGWQAT